MSSAPHWACPCGTEPPKHGTATPVETRVSLRLPTCPFCGRPFREEYRRGDDEEAPTA